MRQRCDGRSRDARRIIIALIVDERDRKRPGIRLRNERGDRATDRLFFITRGHDRFDARAIIRRCGERIDLRLPKLATTNGERNPREKRRCSDRKRYGFGTLHDTHVV